MSIVGDAHDSICRCELPFAHILDNIFPQGHRDRNKTIEEIIQRDIQCLSGGTEEINLGLADGENTKRDTQREGDIQEEENIIPEDDLDELILAAEDTAAR